ncbi:hypothetical protein C8R42DRAFT_138748 [Lentinula raphanica]|nr:hypothetical protein C8R42DRAFT_138748 [Lentinula raphanica]
MYPTTGLNLARIAMLLAVLLFGVRASPTQPRRDMTHMTGTSLLQARDADTITIARPREHRAEPPSPEQLPDDKTFIIQWAPVPHQPGRPQVISHPAVIPNGDTGNWFLFESQLPTLFRVLNDYNEHELKHQGLSVPDGSHVKVIYNHSLCSFKDASPADQGPRIMLYAYIYAQQKGAMIKMYVKLQLNSDKGWEALRSVEVERHVGGLLVYRHTIKRGGNGT